MSVFRTVTIVRGGIMAWGYGLFSSAWDSTRLQGTIAQTSASSESGFAQTTTHLRSFTGYGSFSYYARFAEFSWLVVKGTFSRLMEVGSPGSTVILGVPPAPAEIPLGPGGTLYLDPATLLVVPFLSIPSSGLLDVTLPLPPHPSLGGVQVHLQDLVMPPAGQGSPWLTNSISPIII